jgi:hypothetical protein
MKYLYRVEEIHIGPDDPAPFEFGDARRIVAVLGSRQNYLTVLTELEITF